MRADVLRRARSGDQEAFAQLTDPYRQELQVHCYRMLGSIQDAEDALQETLLGAWQALSKFEERASVRTWLYRIATNRCLNVLRSASRRPRSDPRPSDVPLPEPTRLGDVLWLQPYPDVLLDGLPEETPGPEARYEINESVSLAFVTAIQLLPPRQRAALVLRDVLGYRAHEAAEMLDATVASVENALKRARAGVHARLGDPTDRESPPAPNSAAEQEIVDALAAAFESGDIEKLVSLLTEDVRITMPPMALDYEGRDLARQFFHARSFRPGRAIRIIGTRANGQPAAASYVLDPQTGLYHASGIAVLTLSGSHISAMTGFDLSVLPQFGLPRTLAD